MEILSNVKLQKKINKFFRGSILIDDSHRFSAQSNGYF